MQRHTGFFLGNEHAVSYGYDVSGRLATLSAQSPRNLPAHVFASTHDLIGNQDKTASGTLTLPTTSAPAPCNLDGNLTAGPLPGINRNVSESLATNGGVTVHYEYDPFGNLTRLTGNTSTRFSYRFSTKPRDAATGLYYYGSRWYEPYTGRWINRDPIEVRGGKNVYSMLNNKAVTRIDWLGLIDDGYKFPEGNLKESEPYPDLVVGDVTVTKCPLETRNELVGDYFFKKLAGHKCKVLISCRCSEAEGDSGITTKRITWFGYGDAYAHIELTYNPGSVPDPTHVVHELVHAWDICTGLWKNDCQSKACSEIRAYRRTYERGFSPDLMSQTTDSQWRDLLISSAESSLRATGCAARAR